MRFDSAGHRGWRRTDHPSIALWTTGYLFDTRPDSLAAALAALGPRPEPARIASLLDGLDGHFALAAVFSGATPDDGWALAATDRVRSNPIYFGRAADGSWAVGPHGAALARELDAARDGALPDSVRAIAMAGYTVGTATLYAGLDQLGHGEFLLQGAGDPAPARHGYYRYRPWLTDRADDDALRRDLEETTLRVLDKMARDADGRPIAIPLSAGLDSRLIAAGLHHIGYRNVHCFAYGRHGNREMTASREIADRLGFRWTAVPFTNRFQRQFSAGATYREFQDFADNCDSVQFFQDLPAIVALRVRKWLPDDAILVNGNSGDYLTGNHIPAALCQPMHGAAAETRRERVLDALVARHFTLWEDLLTPENRRAIKILLDAELTKAGARADQPDTDHGLYEYCEFQDRQSKYVISGQRAYEFLGLPWRLPLWDRDYLDFWARAPLSAKAGQTLYRRMLTETDWGGVWRTIPVNRLRVRPAWMVPVRLLAKALLAPRGRAAWHRFEKRHLVYFTDTLCAYAGFPYAQVRRDRRGFRNIFSWLADSYLAEKGLSAREAA